MVSELRPKNQRLGPKFFMAAEFEAVVFVLSLFLFALSLLFCFRSSPKSGEAYAKATAGRMVMGGSCEAKVVTNSFCS